MTDEVREQVQQAWANAYAIGVCVNVRLKIPDDADVTITYGGDYDRS